MKQRSIVYNNFLNSQLKSLGFKRRGGEGFIREFNGVQQIVNFLYSCRNERYVRYYNIHIGVLYPKATELGIKLDCYTAGTVGIAIGYLTPERNYKTWKITDAMSDENIQIIVDDMYRNIVDFAIPYLEKYSVIRNMIDGMESGALENQTDISHNLPILYYLNGESEHALKYMSHQLKTMEQKMMREKPAETPLFLLYNKQPEIDDRYYMQYKQFCDTFILFMESGNSNYK